MLIIYLKETFINEFELGPIFNNVPSKFSHNFVYSLSGSIIYCSIPNILNLKTNNLI